MKARLPKNYGGGGIGNMQQLAMQAQKMQQKMEETTTELEEKEYSATAGGGAVKAEIIYPEMMKAGAYSCNEKLRECDFGLFENHNYIELSGCPEYQAWIDSGGKLPFPEGESREAFIRRTLEGFREVVRDAQAHDRETIAVVAHGGTIMSIMERYAVKEDGTPAGSYYDYQIKNGEGYELRISENDIYDDRDRGGLCSGSDLRGSKMAVSSGEADRASDIGNRKNYQKLSAGE